MQTRLSSLVLAGVVAANYVHAQPLAIEWRYTYEDSLEFAMKERPSVFSRVADGGGGADEDWPAAMNLTDPGKTPENIRNV